MMRGVVRLRLNFWRRYNVLDCRHLSWRLNRRDLLASSSFSELHVQGNEAVQGQLSLLHPDNHHSSYVVCWRRRGGAAEWSGKIWVSQTLCSFSVPPCHSILPHFAPSKLPLYLSALPSFSSYTFSPLRPLCWTVAVLSIFIKINGTIYNAFHAVFVHRTCAIIMQAFYVKVILLAQHFASGDFWRPICIPSRLCLQMPVCRNLFSFSTVETFIIHQKRTWRVIALSKVVNFHAERPDVTRSRVTVAKRGSWRRKPWDRLLGCIIQEQAVKIQDR